MMQFTAGPKTDQGLDQLYKVVTDDRLKITFSRDLWGHWIASVSNGEPGSHKFGNPMSDPQSAFDSLLQVLGLKK